MNITNWNFHNTILLGTDSSASPLVRLMAQDQSHTSYTPFGYVGRPTSNRSGFNGQTLEAAGLYLLGNGRRAFSPAVGRYVASDFDSPFGKGGLNSYAYCDADPINRIDPSGKNWTSLVRKLFSKLTAKRTRSYDLLKKKNIEQIMPIGIRSDAVLVNESAEALTQIKRLNRATKKYHDVPPYYLQDLRDYLSDKDFKLIRLSADASSLPNVSGTQRPDLVSAYASRVHYEALIRENNWVLFTRGEASRQTLFENYPTRAEPRRGVW